MSTLSLTRSTADNVSSVLYLAASVQQDDLQSYETQMGAISTLNVMGLSLQVAVHGGVHSCTQPALHTLLCPARDPTAVTVAVSLVFARKESIEAHNAALPCSFAAAEQQQQIAAQFRGSSAGLKHACELCDHRACPDLHEESLSAFSPLRGQPVT